MDTENVVKHLRLLWRTDRVIAEIRLRHLLVGLGLRAFAALIAVFGLLMFELAAYLALVQVTSAVVAAAALGACNIAIAAILLIIASRAPSGRELELANEIHSSAMDSLQLEARALQSRISSVVNHPLNSLIPLLIVPIATMIIRTLRSHGASEGEAASPPSNDDHHPT
ncbi:MULTISPECIES: phage holin family protein [unclassified Bradyrhizobium]|uniref:phage holin family protein n=1 Tax=unclassified Bradyrhizobium TaxID=2631580 RepID=UPI002916AC50|nr:MULTISPECIES: phage holin family protein [unclassified Bradyrhizobium]